MPQTLRFTSALVLAAFVSLPSEGWPEEQPALLSPVAVGTRVRIAAPTVVSGRVTGLVIGMDEKSLLIVAEDNRLTVPRQAITQLEVSTGKRRRALKGTVIGAGVGLVAFTLGARVTCINDCDEGWGRVVAMGAGMGALYGAGIGALIRTDRWGTVPLEHVRVTVSPTSGRGIQLAVSLGF